MRGATPTTHVLVTGAAGRLGQIICRALADEYVVHGLDVSRGEHVEWKRDMRKLRRVERTFDGMAGVVDLAASASPSASWSTIWENNVPATVNALEAARRRGVRRVIFA